MIAHVIPLKKLPRNLSYFDYAIPSELEKQIKVGSVVYIPWRKQTVLGLVKKIDEKKVAKPVQLKTIIKLAYPDPLATSFQLKLIDRLANKFLTAESIWWKSILPSIPKKQTNIKPEGPSPFLVPLPSLTLPSPLSSPALIIPNNYFDLLSLVKKIIIKDKKNILIICPEIKQIHQILSLLPSSLLSQTLIFHKRLPKTIIWQRYLQVLNKKARIVIGTRLAVFLPFDNLSKIIVVKSEDYSFKQADQNPRFWLHDILPELEKIYKHKSYYLSLAPRLETYAYVKAKRGTIINQQSPLAVRVVSLGDFWQSGDYSFISPKLEESIQQCLANKQKVFLLVNRKQLGLRVRCQDCQNSIICPKCGSAMIVPHEEFILCPLCYYKQPFPSTCPTCQSVNLRIKGLTNQGLVKQLQQKISTKRIQYIDAQHPKLRNETEVIVGTQFALPLLLRKKLGLVGVILADRDIGGYDFRSMERAWQLYSYLIRLQPSLPALIQTFSPNHYFFKYFQQGNYHKFWLTEMKWRRRLKYPPYSKIVKVIKTASNKKAAQAELEKIRAYLVDHLSASVDISLPTTIRLSTKKVQFQSALIIKYTREEISNVLRKLPDNIIFDFNPYKLL